jgi:NADH dehydrogenase FAD-containing subunit
VLEGRRLSALGDRSVALSDGSSFHADLTLLATGTRPPRLFRDSGLTTSDDGGLLVDATLRAVDHPDMFGGGDCISFAPKPLDRVGVHAVRENPVLMNNLAAAAAGRTDFRKYRPQRAYLLILNTGGGRGVLFRSGLVWRGRAAFRLKDYIDQRFMKQFQVSGEAG